MSQLIHLIASVLFLPDGRIFLVDEPQLHLYPGAERYLADFIHEHSEHDYVFATHSHTFIDRIQPDHFLLLSRDEGGTHIQSVFDENVPRARVFEDLGVSAGDIVLSERVLFVEGAGDVEIYTEILKKLDLDPARFGCAILQLRGGDSASPIRDIVAELADLLKLRFLIYLDGDKKPVIDASDVVAFLPEDEIENVLARDAAAVRVGFEDVLEERKPLGVDIDAWRDDWPVDKIRNFIEVRMQRNGPKGSSVLSELAFEMGNLLYRKTVHGPRIAKHLATAHVADLRADLERLLRY